MKEKKSNEEGGGRKREMRPKNERREWSAI